MLTGETSTVLSIVDGLSRDFRDLLLACPTDRHFVAAEIAWSRPGPTGHALSRLAARGLLVSSSDPTTWGRSRYLFTPLGKQVAATLVGEE